MTRSNARELALHLILNMDYTGEQSEDVIRTRLEKEYYATLKDENDVYEERPNQKQLGYIKAVSAGVQEKAEELQGYIKKYAIGWNVSRISRLARAILSLAMFEILYVEDVPVGVAVSEAVRIAKKYDGNDAGAFINGILGSFARSLAEPAAEATE